MNTLGLDDDLDSVELVHEIEAAFGIKISNPEARQLETVGALFDLLLAKLPESSAGEKCASAMAFYRIRRGLKALGYDETFTPSSSLAFLEAEGAKRRFRDLEKETGLRLPGPRAAPGAIFMGGGWVLICTVLGIVVDQRWFLGIAPVCVLLVLDLITRLHPGGLPRNCATLGELTKKTALINLGQLIQKGACRNDQVVWDALIKLLSIYDLPPSEISRDTYFLQSQLRQTAA
ncbi:hypothetical protein sos41_38430 [Alphaproteobacteria bacterium SO-S41]|nr:hypothetical protein sos41_38430 [Alphaproteobacteria bacterium SO-S41]